MRRFAFLVVAGVATLFLTAPGVQADKQVRRTFTVPADLVAQIQAVGCDATPGPQISLQGQLEMSGVIVEVIFARPKGEQPDLEPILVEHVVVPDGQPLGVPGQAIVGSLGDNPFMWLQLTDERGAALTSEIFLGRCDQGQFSPAAHLPIPVTAAVEVTASECVSPTGPAVTLQGAMELSPINGKLIFRSSDITVGGPQNRPSEATTDLVILPAGQMFQFPQQEARGGIGGDPLVSIQLHEADGAALGPQIRLGRCGSLVE